MKRLIVIVSLMLLVALSSYADVTLIQNPGGAAVSRTTTERARSFDFLVLGTATETLMTVRVKLTNGNVRTYYFRSPALSTTYQYNYRIFDFGGADSDSIIVKRSATGAGSAGYSLLAHSDKRW